VNLRMLILCIYPLFLLPPGLVLADGSVTGDECMPAMDAGIYFMTIGPGSDEILRVSLYEHWGDFIIFIDEIWFDEVEGNAHYGDSWELSCYDMALAAGSEWLWRIEFVQWLDGNTFELKANDGEVLVTVEHIGDGVFQISGADQ